MSLRINSHCSHFVGVIWQFIKVTCNRFNHPEDEHIQPKQLPVVYFIPRPKNAF